MFVFTHLLPSGSMTSRADLLGFTDADIDEIKTNRAPLTRRQEVQNALQMAARALFARMPEGSMH